MLFDFPLAFVRVRCYNKMNITGGEQNAMKYSTKLSDATHVLAFVALYENEALRSDTIAESVKTNPAFIRQLMSALKKGGLLTSVKGHPRPSLTRSPDQITLLEIYRAVEGTKPLLHQDIHTNPECGVGVHIQLAIGDFYREIQKAAEDKMQEITLQDILDLYWQKREKAEQPQKPAGERALTEGL